MPDAADRQAEAEVADRERVDTYERKAMTGATQACPVCRGYGWLTGPKSLGYEDTRDSPMHDPPIACEECERTGVVTVLRAAVIESESMDKALAIIDKVRPDLARAAQERSDQRMRDLGIEL